MQDHFLSVTFLVSSDIPSTSMIIPTPARIHFLVGNLTGVLSCAMNTKVLPLSIVLYAGQIYKFLSSLEGSVGISLALQLTTGKILNISFGLDSSSYPKVVSHLAPSTINPKQ